MSFDRRYLLGTKKFNEIEELLRSHRAAEPVGHRALPDRFPLLDVALLQFLHDAGSEPHREGGARFRSDESGERVAVSGREVRRLVAFGDFRIGLQDRLGDIRAA